MVLGKFYKIIGETFGEEESNDEELDAVNFNPGVMADVGTGWVMFFKKLIIPWYARSEEIKRGCLSIGPAHVKCCDSCDCNDAILCTRSSKEKRKTDPCL